MYLGGEWAMSVLEGQVRRRVVGEGLRGRVSFELFGVELREKGRNWKKSTFVMGLT